VVVPEPVIETSDLTVYYGQSRGIVGVNLEVMPGEVFGFLGPNGAGKTTTQRVLLDIIRPTSGSARIFGLDCRAQGSEIRARVGYLPGELNLNPSLTGTEFLNLMASLEKRPVARGFRDDLCDRLELDPSRRIKQYSRGNKQKIGVVAAFMAKPDLIILDEPTTGLDPLIQQTVLDLVREVRDDGRTVFFSSHILQEVQAACDRVGIIRNGELVKTESVEVLTTQQFTRLSLTLRRGPAPDAFARPGVRVVEQTENRLVLEVSTDLEGVIRTALNHGIEDLKTLPVTLEEVFLAYYGKNRKGGADV
jgi:ABC-2 type transport system ATP-binding protein